MEADGVNRRHANGSGNDVLDLLQFAVQGIIGLNDLFTVLVENLAFTSKAKLLFTTLNQEGLELTFKGADLLTDRGLCDGINLRRFRETFRFSEVAKYFQTFNLHMCDGTALRAKAQRIDFKKLLQSQHNQKFTRALASPSSEGPDW